MLRALAAMEKEVREIGGLAEWAIVVAERDVPRPNKSLNSSPLWVSAVLRRLVVRGLVSGGIMC
jgi:hypothetical protein